MNKEEIQNSIKDVVSTEKLFGLTIFACLREENRFRAKKINATKELIDCARDRILEFIIHSYLSDTAEFDSSDNIADNKNVIYEFEFTENYRPFEFLNAANNCEEYYSEKDRSRLCGFLFRINMSDEQIWAYQHLYPSSRIDRSKKLFAWFVKNAYDIIGGDIVQLNSRVDLMILPTCVITSKINLMQQYFGFEEYVRSAAQETIEIICDLDILKGVEKLTAFENNSRLTNAKKLMKAKNSSVLRMDKKDLLGRLKIRSRYKTMFKFEDDYIVISSQKDVGNFIKMVNDDIVRSDLTGNEYDSSSKVLLDN